jgi:SAM-dependent MidA family methyltransferase
VLELGAGTGALAADLLTELAEAGALPARYRILETSADLRARQAERIGRLPAELAARVEWLNTPPTGPWQGVLVANEVFGRAAGATLRAARRGGRARVRRARRFGVFRRVELPADPAWPARSTACSALPRPAYPDPYVSEWQPELEAWLRAVLEQLARGLALFVDYGHARREYYHPSRRAGTLTCHYRQRVHDDALLWPGSRT